MVEPGKRRGRTALIVVGVVVVVAAALGAAALYVVPRVIPNLAVAVAEADVSQALAADGVTATVTVPAGWAYHRGWGDGAELVVRSPDGLLSATISVSSSPAADAVSGGAGDGLGPVVRETLASGLEVFHADAAETGELVAAVGSGTAASVRFHARGPAEGFGAYRAVVARLLESARVA